MRIAGVAEWKKSEFRRTTHCFSFRNPGIQEGFCIQIILASQYKRATTSVAPTQIHSKEEGFRKEGFRVQVKLLTEFHSATPPFSAKGGCASGARNPHSRTFRNPHSESFTVFLLFI
jgi:hypothetical protein